MPTFTSMTVTQAQYVLRQIRKLPYKSDLERWQKPDFWEIADDDGGDCEDLALRARQMLISMYHWHPADIRPTLALNENGEMHGVMTLVFDGHELVLDSRWPMLLTPAQLVARGYRFISRLDPASGKFAIVEAVL